jgi:hypothetical protein
VSLFDLVAPQDQCHPSFTTLLNADIYAGTRTIMAEPFSSFNDSDGNFIEQFQTTGFDARVFELYLHAVLIEQGYIVSRPKPNPDFVAQRQGLAFSIEATTTNPSKKGALAEHGR